MTSIFDRAPRLSRARIIDARGIKLPKPKKTAAQKEREAAELKKHELALETRLIQSRIKFLSQQQLLGSDLASYAWDFAILNAAGEVVLGVEVNGKIWHKGGHSSGSGLLRDWDKWHTLLATRALPTLPIAPEHIKDGRAIGWILGYLQQLKQRSK